VSARVDSARSAGCEDAIGIAMGGTSVDSASHLEHCTDL